MTRTALRRSPAPRAGRLPWWWMRRCLRTWARCVRRLGAGRSGPSAAPAFAPSDDAIASHAAAQTHERRCGWFDSSQDLREGLSIHEHASTAPVAAQLPVMAWVQMQLSGWRPTLEVARHG